VWGVLWADMGSGRFSDKLSYAEWFEFNCAQRGHYNFIEQVQWPYQRSNLGLESYHLCTCLTGLGRVWSAGKSWGSSWEDVHAVPIIRGVSRGS
jgi:hypothetical protein